MDSIGRYRILEELGRGGMATVYRAVDPRFEREVAVKVLHQHLAQDPAVRERFLQEARLAARLQHPNLLSVYDVGDEGGRQFLVMRLVPGGDLGQRLARVGRLSVGETSELLRPLAEAIDAAHAQQVVHRDLKPENVLLTEDGQPLLTDLGIARAVDESGRGLTQTGMVIGTPEYMSPEQAQGLPVDHRSDLYSFGVMAYRMLTGTAPFSGTNPVAIGVQHVRDTPPDPRHWAPELSAEIVSALARMLRKDPAERFPNARSFVAALTASPAERPPAPAPVGQPRMLLLVVMVFALCLGGVLLAGARLVPPEVGPAPPPAPEVEPVPPPAPEVEPPPAPEVEPVPVAEVEPPPTTSVREPIPNAGGYFFRPAGWAPQQKAISSGGYEATRWRWHAPEDARVYLAVEVAVDPNGDPNEGWDDLHHRLANRRASYLLHNLGPVTLDGVRVHLWEYSLTEPDDSFRSRLYKVGTCRNGYGIAVWGKAPAADWGRWGPGLREAVRSYRPAG